MAGPGVGGGGCGVVGPGSTWMLTRPLASMSERVARLLACNWLWLSSTTTTFGTFGTCMGVRGNASLLGVVRVAGWKQKD